MGIRLLIKKDEAAPQNGKTAGTLKMFLSSFAVGITNPAAILTFLFAFSYFGISAGAGQLQGFMLVCGIFIGTYIWWETLTAITNIIKEENMEENTVEKMTLQIGNNTFMATLENNDAVDALMDMMREAPIVIQMSDYSGFEKVGSLGTSLPTSNKQTTTQSGDIVLYNGNQIVIFYGSNSWSYTRLGKIDDLSGWEDALGSGDVTVTFSLK